MFKWSHFRRAIGLMLLAGLLIVQLAACSCNGDTAEPTPTQPKTRSVQSGGGSQITILGSTSVDPASARGKLRIDDIDQGKIGTSYPTLPGGSKAAAIVNVTPNDVSFSPPVTLKFSLPQWYQPATLLTMFHLREGSTAWESIALAEVDGSGVVAEGEISSTSLYAVAEPEEEQSVPQLPMELSIGLSSDSVIAGECSGPDTLVITAELTGSGEQIAEVGGAKVTFRWVGGKAQTVEMERMDDSFFIAEIGPFDYCCEQTEIAFAVVIMDRFGEALISELGMIPLEYCIG